jgi:DNA-binding LytR/AlgR family response regulator
MIRCLAIDDEPLALQQLVAYINKVPFLELAAQCQSALEAREFLQDDTADAIFCDINMPDLNGMDFVKSLVAPPLVVFTTAYSEYAVEGFRVNAVDYLLKPFGLQDFQRAANRIKERLQTQQQKTLPQPLPAGKGEDTPATVMGVQGNFSPPSQGGAGGGSPSAGGSSDIIFLKTDYRIVKVSISDIRYVEGMSEYLKVWLEGQPKPIITLLSMKKMEERLPANFMRIHRSYIINLDMIQEVNKNRVIMDAETYLPIGDLYKEAFQAYLDTKYLGK